MKSFSIICALMIFAMGASAQEAIPEEPKPAAEIAAEEQGEAEARRAAAVLEARRKAAAKRLLEAEAEAAKRLEERPFTFGGFLVELGKAKDKKRFLSLRQPRETDEPPKNLHLDPRTKRPKGFVLVSIDF